MTTFEPFDGNLIVGNPGMEFAGHRRSRVCSIAGAHVVADFDLSCGFNGTTSTHYISDLEWLQMCLRTQEEEGILMCRKL